MESLGKVCVARGLQCKSPTLSCSIRSPLEFSKMNFSTISSGANGKPIIHHIPSPASLASLTSNPSLLSLPKSDPSAHNSSVDSPTHSSITSGLVLKPGDVWSQVVLRVIPLFNGEGHKGFIEDLNDFVSQHIHKTIADSPSKSITKLHSDVTELFANGVMILNNRLQPDQLSDERLLVRVFEVWHFFFTGVLPYLEAIFLPLMSDENLLNMIESKNNKDLQERLQQQHLLQQATTNARLFSSTSTSLLFRQSNRNPQNPSRHRSTGSHSSRAEDVIQEIDIRRLALIAFRKQLCLPIFSRLYNLFTMLYDPTTWEASYGPINLSSEAHSEHMHLKRLQMVGLLCSVQSNDSPQSMMEGLSRLIRLKKANPDLLKLPPSNLANVPLRKASANNKTPPVAASPKNELDNPPDQEWSLCSSSQSHPHQHSTPRQSSNLPGSNPTKADGYHYDDDRPLVQILEDEISSQEIKGWNKNRDFARRSIRRQLSRSGTNSRASRPKDDVPHPPPRDEAADPTARKPERRLRRNRATDSISRVIEDAASESSVNRTLGSPLITPAHSTFSSQPGQQPSVDADEHLLDHSNKKAYSRPTEGSSGH